jgi:UDP-N-acetylglucosamine--N-acetylmuramyl-(pentapeptide) pyrophosphoryl-undecaprenol N-acetylglucosamine transferase
VPRILYGFSPIGLGHATRALAVSEELRKAGADVKMFSGGKAAEFFRDQGLVVNSTVDDAVPTVVNGEMRQVTLWYLRSWLALRRTMTRTERLFDDYDPDLVVCDEEFSGIVMAGKRGTKRVFISDELSLGFARTWLAHKVEERIDRWYRNLQNSVDLLIIPESGEDSGNRRYVGPIVRSPSISAQEVKARHGLPRGRMVLFSMSGSGIGRELASKVVEAIKKSEIGDAYLVVTGNRGTRIQGQGVYDLGLVSDNQNLVACADLVISTAGKSTIDEAAAAGTPIVAIPIRYHAEQERNASALGYAHSDSERLPELIREKIGRRGVPQKFNGEQVAARLILSMA